MTFGDRLEIVLWNPLILLLMIPVAYILKSGLSLLVSLIFTKIFPMKTGSLEVFGAKYMKDNSGKWEKSGQRAAIGFSAEHTIDLTRLSDIDKAASKERAFMLVTSVIMLILTAGAFAGCFAGAMNIDRLYVNSAVFYMGFWMLLFAVVTFINTLRAIAITSSGNSLGAYAQTAINMLRKNIPFEQQELKPVGELNLKKVTNAERYMYFPLYFTYLDACDRFELMPEAVNEIERFMSPNPVGKTEQLDCVMLTYYYSRHNIIPYKAKEYYHKAENILEKDTDPNSMVIKGFYQLNCFGDVNRAEQCVRKALEGIEAFSVPVEREYVRGLIAKLNQSINKLKSTF